MNDYRVYVNVTAVAGRWVTVTAENEDDASARVETMIEDGHVDLDWGHYNIGCDRVERLDDTPATAGDGRGE